MSDVPVDREFWRDALKRIARRTHTYEEAEDLLHSAFLRMARYGKDHIIDNPVAFLVRTAANIRIDNYRHDRMVAESLAASDLDRGNGALQDEVMVARARLKRVSLGLAELPERTRDMFLMHRLEGLKYREIAERLGVSQSSVEKHIAKAMLFLAQWTKDW
jgi:RNA polymerase sigma factor (sigma-70 family)